MITFKHDCPHCRLTRGKFKVTGLSCNKACLDDEYYYFSLMAVCDHCDRAMMTEIDVLDMGVANNLLKLYKEKDRMYVLDDIWDVCAPPRLDFYPKPLEPEIPEYLPKEVIQKIRTAEKLYIQARSDDDMLEPTGNAYRKTLEVALKELDVGDIDKNLNWRINSLVKTGILVKAMGDFAHNIRSLGNDATHGTITFDELGKLKLFTNLFLQYAFTLPRMIPDKVEETKLN